MVFRILLGAYFSYMFVFFVTSGATIARWCKGLVFWCRGGGHMCEKHFKYRCFLMVPHFSISWYFGVLRSTFGRRFGSFLEAWGSKSVFGEVSVTG